MNANDLAVRGATPRWFLATCLLPEGRTPEADVAALFAQLGAACQTLEVALVGGHTAVTPGLDRPIVVGTMLGEVDKPRLVTTGGARPGDVLVLTKGVPVEGTSIIARARAAELRDRGYDEAWLARARGMLGRLSVVPEARLATDLVSVHAMHDPTEGGVATALWEIADAADVGLAVEVERIPVLPEGAALCRAPARLERGRARFGRGIRIDDAQVRSVTPGHEYTPFPASISAPARAPEAPIVNL